MLHKKHWLLVLATVSAVGVVASGRPAFAAEPSSAGVVRISDRANRSAASATSIQQIVHRDSRIVYRPVSPHHLINARIIPVTGRYVDNGAGCDSCSRGNQDSGSCLFGCKLFRCKLLRWCHKKDLAYKKCKFGYFIPTGCGGGGCPPFGLYDVVYPVNPQHFDARDGKLYAAQGYGVPMAVPLAPNVRQGYNYGWGIPSSRLTKFSNPAPHVQYVNP